VLFHARFGGERLGTFWVSTVTNVLSIFILFDGKKPIRILEYEACLRLGLIIISDLAGVNCPVRG
jgi:hypothetical protein